METPQMLDHLLWSPYVRQWQLLRILILHINSRFPHREVALHILFCIWSGRKLNLKFDTFTFDKCILFEMNTRLMYQSSWLTGGDIIL